MVTAKPKKTSPTWNDVKAKVTDFDRAGLLGVLQDLYAASKDNQAFLHARFGLGVDVLEPYKVIHQPLSVARRAQRPVHVSFQGQEGDCRLQEGYRAA